MLREIPGGSLNAKKLMNHLLDAIKSVKPLGNNAASIVISKSLSKAISFINFPKKPKVTTMLYHHVNHKTVDLEKCNWPVAITGDG